MHDLGLDMPAVWHALGVSRGVPWKMLTGRQDVRISEAAALAKLLEVSIPELLRQFGVQAPDHTVPVTGILRSHGRVTAITPDRVYRVPGPPGIGPRGVAIQIEGAHTAFALFDGSHLYYEPTDNVAVDAFDRLSVVHLADQSALVVGVLTRGSLRHVKVLTFGGLEPIESQQLIGAWPVRWQRMG